MRDGLDYQDDEGISLPDAEAAYAEALRGARSIMASSVARGHLHLNGEIEVVEASGKWRRVVPFREALAIED
jgi:hypothetical protein